MQINYHSVISLYNLIQKRVFIPLYPSVHAWLSDCSCMMTKYKRKVRIGNDERVDQLEHEEDQQTTRNIGWVPEWVYELDSII